MPQRSNRGIAGNNWPAKVCALFVLLAGFLFVGQALAEDKSEIPSGQNIPKIPSTPDDPKLVNGHVYPNWGPICQKYTYSVIYVDDKDREPKYVKIYFNGQMYDMEKEDADSNDYSQGVKYLFTNVPNKLGSNFYYFEASNGLGQARSNIIDSPDNGPVLFKNAFDKNEIAVISTSTREKILSYQTKDEWVGGVALSDNGQYLAAKTHKKIYLFDTAKPKEPVWVYEGAGESPGDVKGGVDISGDGTKIIASINGQAILFSNQSSKPLWIYKGSGNQAYNVAISRDGQYMAMGTAGSVSSTTQGYQSSATTNLLILWHETSAVPLWQYHTEGNFHDVSLSDDGSFITGATGCPDRRFYLFSKDSNTPLIKSEMLTRDSPVHRAKISGDGEYAAVGSESNDGAAFLFSKKSDKPVWKFAMPGRSSVRALNFTADGRYIGAATFKGDAYVFSRDSNVPIEHWKVNTSLGGLDIAEDGSFIAAGGSDSKLHIFQQGSETPHSIDFNEYVQEVDISADNKYIAAGTGGSVYFFEAFEDENQAVTQCREITEPPAENTNLVAGNAQFDNAVNTTPKKSLWPGMLFGFGFFGSLLALAGYIAVIKFDLISKLKRVKEKGLPDNLMTGDSQTKLTLNKTILVTLGVISLIFLVLTIFAGVINIKNKPGRGNANNQAEQTEPANKGDTQPAGCGNSICEPDHGETKTNCPSDCMQ